MSFRQHFVWQYNQISSSGGLKKQVKDSKPTAIHKVFICLHYLSLISRVKKIILLGWHAPCICRELFCDTWTCSINVLA